MKETNQFLTDQINGIAIEFEHEDTVKEKYTQKLFHSENFFLQKRFDWKSAGRNTTIIRFISGSSVN